MKNKFSLLVLLVAIGYCSVGNAALFGNGGPVVAFPEVQGKELRVETAPVVAVNREVRTDYQVASTSSVARDTEDYVYNRNKLRINRPNLKYQVGGEEIVVPVAAGKSKIVTAKNESKTGKSVKIENDPLDKEMDLKKQEIARLQKQILEQEQKLEDLKQSAILPAFNENSKKAEVQEKEQIVLPYKFVKTKESPLVKEKRIEYPKDVKREFEKVYMSENQYLTLMEGDMGDDFMEEDLDPMSENDMDDFFVESSDLAEDVGPLPAKAFSGSDVSLNNNKSSSSKSSLIVENGDLLKNLDAFSQESVSAMDLEKKIDILQMKVAFEEGGSSVNTKNIELISSFASIVLNNPTNGVELYISDQSLTDTNSKKLMAKRLAVVSRILKDQGIKEYQIKPVLSKRPFNSMVLKIVDLDSYKQAESRKTDAFGNVIKEKAFRAINW